MADPSDLLPPLTAIELASFRTVEDVLGEPAATLYKSEQLARRERNAAGAVLYPEMPPERDPALPDLREQNALRKRYPSMFPPERR
jgi:hypothetical protein